MDDFDRTASLMTPAKLAEVKHRTPVSPSAWLDRMASDAGHQHIKNIGDLAADLREQTARRDYQPLKAALSALAETLPKLDFGLLQPRGLMARLSGKARTAGAEFAVQHEQIDAAAQALAAQVQALAKRGEQAAGAGRTLLEIEVEFRALEKIIDQATRWLQDMRNQLKTREAAGGDETVRKQIEEDTARCELLVARLKVLRLLSSAAQQTHQQAEAAATRRTNIVQTLQRALANDVKDWRKSITPLAESARDGGSTTHSLEGAMDCHRDLQLCIKQAMADCGQVQAQEKALVESLDTLAGHLTSAA